MNARQLLADFERLSEAPDAITRLRQFILDLAMRGRLAEHDPADTAASKYVAPVPPGSKRGAHVRPVRALGSNPLAASAFPVPDSWGWVHLLNIAEVSYGFAFESVRFNSQRSGMPLIRIRDISSADAEAYYDGAYDPDYQVHAGDYLVGMDGNFNLRKWRGADALLNQRVMRVRNWSDQVVADFMAIPLQMSLDRLHDGTSQTTVKHLSAKQVNTIVLPLPPLAEQHRIVAKVDELMALCDQLELAQTEREKRRDRVRASATRQLLLCTERDAVGFRAGVDFYVQHSHHLTTRPEHVAASRLTIRELAIRGWLVPQDPTDEPAAVLLRRIHTQRTSNRERPASDISESRDHHAFRVPSGWEWATFGDLILGSEAGWSPQTDNFPRSGNNWGVLKVSAVSWDRFMPNENKQLLPDIVPPPNIEVCPGDFLISRANTKELVAKCVLVESTPEHLILSDKIVRLHLADEVNWTFLVMVNNHASYARDYYAKEASGASSSMKNVSRDVIYALPVPVPPDSEQRRIVAKVDELMALCDDLERRLAAAQTGRARLLEAVLAEALSGPVDKKLAAVPAN